MIGFWITSILQKKSAKKQWKYGTILFPLALPGVVKAPDKDQCAMEREIQ
jgi:hypothetical protein|tara:strand:- start:975 stop:1124 length:150 start_codon:yes stop_codon:yes gene_type:complete